ncbi:hypothetical protein V6N11_061341 [Hibiscus sabdariffa]|uniref:Ysc84 actin-binding domain-containing protein n=1 Tax=Hibiscus sabdariffa TaxID=183260 RepID=A0ABR2NV83_9ROSI
MSWHRDRTEICKNIPTSCPVAWAFVGVSLEGNIVPTRMDANLRFYADPYLTTADILLRTVDRPKAAEPLYTALGNLYSSLRC